MKDRGVPIDCIGLQIHVATGRPRATGPHLPVVRVVLESLALESITFWGFTDKRAWLLEVFAGYGSAHLYDEAHQPKPAYFGVLDALM